MNEELKRVCERISKFEDFLTQNPKEENVKQKIVIPLLEALGYKDKMIFEHGRGKEIDIFLDGLPRGRQVIIETKKFNEDLDKHIPQVESYYKNEDALLAIITNGIEIRIYSKIHGFYFTESLLYSIKVSDIDKPENIQILEKLLSRESLTSKESFKLIQERTEEIRSAYDEVQEINRQFSEEKEKCKRKIKDLENEIEKLNNEYAQLGNKLNEGINTYFQILGLPNVFSNRFIPSDINIPIPIDKAIKIKEIRKTPKYLEAKIKSLKSPTSHTSRMKEIIEQHKTILRNDLVRQMSKKFPEYSTTAGSWDASIHALVHMGCIKDEGRADERKLTFLKD
jgi:DNA repair exonuclease SbcCD ATPase subunit